MPHLRRTRPPGHRSTSTRRPPSGSRTPSSASTTTGASSASPPSTTSGTRATCTTAAQRDEQAPQATYGEPSAWPYHNFINGARDKAGNFVQFAPKLEVGRAATSTRTSGRSCSSTRAPSSPGRSPSTTTASPCGTARSTSGTRWPAGPRLDLLRLHADAIRAKGLKLLVAMHHAYNFTGFYERVPTQSDHQPEEALRPARHGRGEPALVRQAARRSSTATSRTSSGRTSTWTASTSRSG